jgi:hypothetical protein
VIVITFVGQSLGAEAAWGLDMDGVCTSSMFLCVYMGEGQGRKAEIFEVESKSKHKQINPNEIDRYRSEI